MIFIHGTHVEKHNISMFFLHFSEIIFFGVSSGVKGQKMAQNDKKLSAVLHISESIHHVIVFFGGHLKNDDISRCFFHFFQNVDFLGCLFAKRAKNDQFISLYLKNCRSYHQDFQYTGVKYKIMVSPNVFFNLIYIIYIHIDRQVDRQINIDIFS